MEKNFITHAEECRDSESISPSQMIMLNILYTHGCSKIAVVLKIHSHEIIVLKRKVLFDEYKR
jgi:hypothetical protein